MKTIKILFLSGLVSTLFSCTKAGTGGKVEVACFPQHHEKAIKGATVYVKFNAKDFPGTDITKYDLAVAGEENEEHVHVEDLKKGSYYFYAAGYDSTISQAVYGGLLIKIKEKSGEIDLDIPVTE